MNSDLIAKDSKSKVCPECLGVGFIEIRCRTCGAPRRPFLIDESLAAEMCKCPVGVCNGRFDDWRCRESDACINY